MPSRIERSLGAALLSLFIAQVAVAGPLYGDPAALISGSATFSGNNGLPVPLTHTIHAQVEYAVYSPGTFSTSDAAHLNFPADISAGTQFIYAYEVFNDGTDATVTSLSVGLFSGGVADTATLINHLSDPQDPPGQAPFQWNFNPSASGSPKTSAVWQFDLAVPAVAVGQHSDILIFASPNMPDFKVSSIIGEFATGASAPLPSPVTPIPEPGTLLLAAGAVVGLLATRFLKRQRR